MSNVRARRRVDAALGSTSLAIAHLRGAALAVAAAAAAVEQHIGAAEPCPGDDHECRDTRYTQLLRHRELVRRADEELERVERTRVAHPGMRVEFLGWDVPYVRASRTALDRANDAVLTALTAARSALRPLGADGSTTGDTDG